ncbi:MAG: hypothetical protein IJX53_04505 [Clostridia bacterium]|nr:hypothetical protein [Clostridia bacterium]
MNIALHDHIQKELLTHHSLAAALWLIDAGRELEFACDGHTGFISASGSSHTVSLWQDDVEQAFDSAEALFADADFAGSSLLALWEYLEIITLF